MEVKLVHAFDHEVPAFKPVAALSTYQLAAPPDEAHRADNKIPEAIRTPSLPVLFWPLAVTK
jgi:hypothetical protein